MDLKLYFEDWNSYAFWCEAGTRNDLANRNVLFRHNEDWHPQVSADINVLRISIELR